MHSISSRQSPFNSPWIPAFEHEEVLGSFQLRACILAGESDSSDFLRKLSGRVAGVSWGLEFGLNRFFEVFRQAGMAFPRGFLAEHCLSALGLPFCPPDQAAKKYEALTSSTDAAGRRALGMESVSLYPNPRFCPVCTESDTSRRGFSYWRRTPQILGVLYCPIHEVKTVGSCRRCSGLLQVSGLPSCVCPGCGAPVEVEQLDHDDEKRLLELRFADAVNSIFEGRITGPMTSTTIRARIAELVPQRPSLPGITLVDYVADTVDPAFLDLIDLPIDRHNKFPWPVGLCAPGVVFNEAVVQLLVYALLSRDKPREEMFRPCFPTSPQWTIASRPHDVIHLLWQR